MNETLIETLLTLLGGGAMGALIKIAYDFKRERVQSIFSGVRVFSLFRRDDKDKEFHAVVSVVHDGRATEFGTIYVADVMLRNSSDRDYSVFDFGIAMGAGSKCVHVGWENPDQHHILSTLDAVSPSEPQSELKFQIQPFNRRDVYSLRLYLVPGSREEEPTVKALTSPHAVRFVDDPSFGERSNSLHNSALWLIIISLLLGLVASITYQYVSTGFFLEKTAKQQREQQQEQRRSLELFAECSERGGKLDFGTLSCIELPGPQR
jgi:hypothetical protein